MFPGFLRRLGRATRLLTVAAPLAATLTPALAGPPAVAPVPTDPHPLRFTPNRRQWPAPVLFAADVPGGRLYLERGRLLVARYDAQAVDEQHHHPIAAPARVAAHAYAVNFVGANPHATATGEQPTGSYSNYFLGNDARRWATGVPAYTDVRYRNLYPGTDLRIYSRGPVLEYDFELTAGADAARIGLRYDGQTSLRVVAGALQIGTSVGRVTEQRPVAYQLIDGQRRSVACRYELGLNHTVRFGLPNGYDHSRPLVIDPVLVYSTYSGATAQNWGYTACPDTLGNLYAASVNFAAGYPTTTGAYDASFDNNGDTDIVISKYNPAGSGRTSLVYATYLGGGGDDRPHSLVVNRAGELVLLGSSQAATVTSLTNTFPTTTGAFDRNYNGGGADVVVAKLSANGSQLLASTFVGGSGLDGLSILTPGNRTPANASRIYNNFGDNYRGDLITDRQNNVYFASVSRAGTGAGPIAYPSLGGYQAPNRGGADAVVTKLTPMLSAVLWSARLGGTLDDAAYSLQLDSLNGVFVAGGTLSNNFSTTPGTLHPTFQSGVADGWVAHLSPDGSQLVRSTYLGTSGYDQAFFVQLDRKARVYVLGQTNGAYPVTSRAYSNPGSRQFIHQLDYTLATTGFSTVIGNGAGPAPTTANPSPHNLSPTAFLVDNCGGIFFSGWGASSIAGMPTTPDALQASAPNTAPQSGDDFNDNTFGYLYLAQLSPGARRLVYGTYFGTGTTHVDGGTSRFDKKGIIYQAICVRNLPSGARPPVIRVTPNAFASVPATTSTSSAAFKMDISHLDADFVPAANGTAGNRTGCAPLTVSFTRANPSLNGTTWDFGNGRTSTQANNVSTTYPLPGTYTVLLTAYDSTSCQPAVTSTTTITVLGLPSAALGPDQSICPGGSTILNAGSGAPAGTTFAWSPAAGLSAITGPSVTASPTVTTTYTVTATAAGCTGTSSIVVSVAPTPALTIGADNMAPMAGQAVQFVGDAANAFSAYDWDFGDGQTGNGRTVAHTFATPGSYTVRLTGTYGTGCTTQQTLALNVAPATPPRPEAHPNIITPNGDNLNDTFKPYVSAEAVTLQVFNRWGRLVYEQADYQGTWGGGPEVAPGLYFYHLSTAAGQSWKGWLEVMK